MHSSFGLLIAYVAGSFPSAYLAGRVFKGIDLRTMGSGNLGATNVYRNLGLGAALIVLLIDLLKGALPVYLLPILLHADQGSATSAVWWRCGYGFAAIAGHAKPIFLLWKGGGKGVATAAGMFAVLVPAAVLATTVLCAVALWSTGYMSLGSVIAALALPALVWLERGPSSPVFASSLVVSGFILWTHRSNLRRLRTGTEHRLFQESETKP